MNEEKIRLRKRLKEERLAAVAEDVSGLWKKIESMPSFQRSGTVLLYWSLPDEVPTHEFITRWAGRKRIALPVVVGDDMILREYSSDKMVEGYGGILEPGSQSVQISPSEIDFAIIPGVAFDRQGNRMGRGKGFYDRFLPLLNCETVGVARAYQMVDSVPTDPWDQKLDAVVTP